MMTSLLSLEYCSIMRYLRVQTCSGRCKVAQFSSSWARPCGRVGAQTCRAAIGIDLGTTNSLVSVVANGKPELVPDAEGRLLLPSVLNYTGAGAAAFYAHCMKHVKRCS